MLSWKIGNSLLRNERKILLLFRFVKLQKRKLDAKCKIADIRLSNLVNSGNKRYSKKFRIKWHDDDELSSISGYGPAIKYESCPVNIGAAWNEKFTVCRNKVSIGAFSRSLNRREQAYVHREDHANALLSCLKALRKLITNSGLSRSPVFITCYIHKEWEFPRARSARTQFFTFLRSSLRTPESDE